MDQIHDFDDTVVAILHDDESVDAVVDRLAAVGYQYELLQGEEGKAHLDPDAELGPGATLKRLLKVLGDQLRVVDHLREELDRGNTVISVDAKPDEANEAVRILKDNGGDFIWKMGSWTFTRIGQ